MAEYVWIDASGGLRSKSKVSLHATFYNLPLLRPPFSITRARVAARTVPFLSGAGLVGLGERAQRELTGGAPASSTPRQPFSLLLLLICPPRDKFLRTSHLELWAALGACTLFLCRRCNSAQLHLHAYLPPAPPIMTMPSPPRKFLRE
jgi:hypothetical protein